MTKKFERLKETASQTAGPYVHIGLTPNFTGIEKLYAKDLGSSMVNAETKGERITISGRVFDGADAPLTDALLEIWQADAAGLYNSPSETRGSADPNFPGWGRCSTHMESGVYTFETIKPGRVPFSDGSMMAPHISFWIVARGINVGLQTRLYFSDEQAANAKDPILNCVEGKERVPTLVGQRNGDTYTFDIRLQGAGETVFFDI